MIRWRAIPGLAALLLVLVSAEAAMGLGKTFVLCSAVDSRLVDARGVPQPGVRISRVWKWHWNDTTGADETVTDADGRFRLPEISDTSVWAGLAPHEPMIDATVTAHGPDGEVLLFAVTKRDYAADAELAGRDLTGPGIRLVCRIDAEPDRSGPFRGTCRAMD